MCYPHQSHHKNHLKRHAVFFVPVKAPKTILVKLGKTGLELNKKKFHVFGTTDDACADNARVA